MDPSECQPYPGGYAQTGYCAVNPISLSCLRFPLDLIPPLGTWEDFASSIGIGPMGLPVQAISLARRKSGREGGREEIRRISKPGEHGESYGIPSRSLRLNTLVQKHVRYAPYTNCSPLISSKFTPALDRSQGGTASPQFAAGRAIQ